MSKHGFWLMLGERERFRHALVALAFLAAGLGLARVAGVVAGGGLSAYTTMALIIELASWPGGDVRSQGRHL